MVKVVFWINRFDAEKTSRIMKIFFKNKPYIKVTVEDNSCILNCHDLGEDPVGYVVEYLIQQKRFMGKYHHSFEQSLFLQYRQDRLQIPVCRFGWFDACLASQMTEFNFWKTRFENLISGMILHEAELDAKSKTGFDFATNDENKRYRYDSYVRDLVKYRGKTIEEAKMILDPIFPGWKNFKIKVNKPIVLTPEQKKEAAKKELKMIHDLIGKLKFMSPKMRKKYLNQNLLDELRIKTIRKSHGIDWIIENIGEIPGYTDI